MASSDVMHLIEQDLLSSKDDNGNSRGLSIEKKIEYLESLTGKERVFDFWVSNRRSRRWINDRLLMELVPRLNAGEIRGLFAPPPWGDDVPISPFCMTNVGEWDRFRNIDMDKQANIIDVPSNQSAKRQAQGVSDKMVTLNAWRRIDSRTRDVLCRTFLTEVLEVYEDCVRAFIQQNGDDTLTLAVQDPFHRLLLHGVCEFYNLVSVTVSASEGTESSKMTRVAKKSVAAELPNLTLCYFLKMSKKGIW